LIRRIEHFGKQGVNSSALEDLARTRRGDMAETSRVQSLDPGQSSLDRPTLFLMPPYPKSHILQLAQASFERVSKFSNGKPRVFYPCCHLTAARAHRGHHREFCAHNDSFVLGELKKRQNNHPHFVQLRFTQFGFARRSRENLFPRAMQSIGCDLSTSIAPM
jgi:hypothetical protein